MQFIQIAAEFSLGSVYFDSLRFSLGNTPPPTLAFAAALLSRTTISLLECEFLSQIGKCLCAASSENIRGQCGHCLRLSIACLSCELTVLPVKLYWLVLSVDDRPIARRTYSLSYFHLGTFWPLTSLLSSLLPTLRGGLADVIRCFLVTFVV